MMSEKRSCDHRKLSATVCLYLLSLVMFCGCAHRIYEENGVKPGVSILKSAATINGMSRTSLVYIPNSYDPDRRYPLVVLLHGAFSTAEQMMAETGFDRLADRENFIVLAPNGMGLFGFLQHWNAGHCCGKAVSDGLDDVSFVAEGIRLTADLINIDQQRIYLVGFSNGGMLAYRYAAERSEQVAAFAVLAASAGGRPDQGVDIWLPALPHNPVPVMIIHSMDDPIVPPAGGRSPKKGGEREYLSLEQSTAIWLKANGCKGPPLVDEDMNGLVTVNSWKSCEGRSAVVLMMIRKWEHQWPGPYFIGKKGDLAGLDATETIWQFFREHALPSQEDN